MLVLSRKKDEKIIINNGEIVITVVEIRDGKVRLGIEAPKEIPVHREEVFEAIKRTEERDKGKIPGLDERSGMQKGLDQEREEADPKERWME